MACTEIITGRYYKLESVGAVCRAELCQFCNGIKVIKYHECLFKGRGVITWRNNVLKEKSTIFSCQAKYYAMLTEITEDEYLVLKTEKTL